MFDAADFDRSRSPGPRTGTSGRNADTRREQILRFREIAATMDPGLARSGILAAAWHLEQEVREHPESAICRMAFAHAH